MKHIPPPIKGLISAACFLMFGSAMLGVYYLISDDEWPFIIAVVVLMGLSFLITGIVFAVKCKEYTPPTPVKRKPITPKNNEYTSIRTSHQSSSHISPEDEVEEYMNGERGFDDLSPDAETWFFEEMDDD